MTSPFLLTKEISDLYVRRNFKNLQDYFAGNNQLLGFVFFEKQYTAAGANQKIAHGLTTAPKDVIVTKIVGSGSVTFNHGLFDATNLDVTVTGACTIRFFVGTYWNSGSSPTPSVTDATTYSSAQTSSTSSTGYFGQCRLSLVNGALRLLPYGGNKITVNGVNYTIPTAGVAVPSTLALYASQLYYVYAYINNGVLSLTALGTAYATDPTTGMTVKSDNVAYTLVGMARTTSAAALVNTSLARFVRTWFNDLGVDGRGTYTTNRSYSSAANGEINSEIRIEFLSWANEVVEMAYSGSHSNTTATNNNATGLGIDSTTTMSAENDDIQSAANTGQNHAGSYFTTSLTEGYHYLTLISRSANSTAITYTQVTNLITLACRGNA